MFLNRLNILLALLLVVCALALVTAQHRARKLFVEHERARAASRQLETRWNELQVQQTQFAKTSLIDAKARQDMGMQAVPPERLVHLEQREAPATMPAATPAPQSPRPLSNDTVRSKAPSVAPAERPRKPAVQGDMTQTTVAATALSPAASGNAPALRRTSAGEGR